MPFINVKISSKLKKSDEIKVKELIGESISIIPGKSEERLMINFEDECKMYFKGTDQEASAIVSVDLFGKAEKSVYNSFTKRITEILSEELSIQPDRTFVKYGEYDNWGLNGSNF